MRLQENSIVDAHVSEIPAFCEYVRLIAPLALPDLYECRVGYPHPIRPETAVRVSGIFFFAADRLDFHCFGLSFGSYESVSG